MSEHFGVPLDPRKVAGTPKKFDLVSPDGSIVGNAKYYTMVRGISPASAKCSVIAEHVWLLEHTRRAETIPRLRQRPPRAGGMAQGRGHLVNGVDFYFIDQTGSLSLLS